MLTLTISYANWQMVNAEVCFFRDLEDCWVSYWMLLGCNVHANELAYFLAFYVGTILRICLF